MAERNFSSNVVQVQAVTNHSSTISKYPNDEFTPSAAYLTVMSVVAILFFVTTLHLWRSTPANPRRKKPRGNADGLPWEQLFETAEQAITNVISELPSNIKAVTGEVPYLLEKWCPAGQNLGLYGVTPLEMAGKISETNGPIFIYIGNHYIFCDDQGLDFETEIRRTYLHELCHHFGLDEREIEERGLA